MKHKTSQDALSAVLTQEGINFPMERAGRIMDRLETIGWEITKNGNWGEREPQVLGLVQDEI